MKKLSLIILMISALILPTFVGCTGTKDSGTTTAAQTNAPTEPAGTTEADDGIAYILKYAEGSEKIAEFFKKKLAEKIGAEIACYPASDTSDSANGEKEILLNADDAYKDLIRLYGANKNTYNVSMDVTENGSKILIYYSDYMAGFIAADTFIESCVTENSKLSTLTVPEAITGTATKEADYNRYEELICYLVGGDVTDLELITPLILRKKIARLSKFRDPAILYDNGKYYAISNNSGQGYAISSASSLYGVWTASKSVVKMSELNKKYNLNALEGNYTWAPELHKYDGNYYIFATYFCRDASHDSPYDDGSGLGHRASIILKASDPMGPYELVSKNAEGEYGHSTPANWDTIDATLYVDKNGDPWMVFVHEWTSIGVGDFSVVKLSKDLSTALTEPQTIFTAKAEIGDRTTNYVTDGCWMYTTEGGELLCLWSSFIDGKYVVACARSKSGDILGPWEQDEDLLYEKGMYNDYDGGHPCILTCEDGQMYLVFHSPNDGNISTELPTFIPIIEKDNKLVWGVKAK